MNVLKIITFFYPEDSDLRRLLLHHSRQVRDKALAILRSSGVQLDAELAAEGAMLHDVGIRRCHAPGIFCCGTEPYLAHGILGGAMLREYGATHGLDLERHARICERHTGSGLPAAEIAAQGLPLPLADWVPETPEEELVCLADKFYSKSRDLSEKPLDRVRTSMLKFGPASLARFDALCRKFKVGA